MNPIISFISGIIASMTPCIIVLLPILLYRFHNKKKVEYKEIFLFSIGFLVPFIIIGSLFSSLYNSSIQDGIKLGMGLLFIIIGILAIKNKINPMNIKIVKNPLLFGALFSFALSINPCTIPYTGLILTLSKTEILFQMFIFGLGLITPSIIFGIIGQKLINFSKTNSNVIKKITHLMNFILIASGIYIITTLREFSRKDSLTTIIFIIFIFIILIRSYFLINTKKDLKKPINIILFISLILILFAATYHCDHFIKENKLNQNSFTFTDFANLNQSVQQSLLEHESCNIHNENCETCKRCTYIFGFATFLGFSSIILTNKINSKRSKK